MKSPFLLFLVLAPLQAQTLQNNVELPSSAHDAKIEKNERTVESDEALIPALKGLVIGTDKTTVLAQQQTSPQGIRCHGLDQNTVHLLEKSLHPYLGKSISLHDLDLIAKDIETVMANADQGWKLATFPPQEITAGTIAIHMITPIIGDVAVKGQICFGKEYLRDAINTRPGDLASHEQVRKDIDFLQSNPFRKARAVWQPNPEQKERVDLLYRIQETRPWSVFTGFDNYASKRLGNERLYVGGKWGDVAHRDHRLTWLLMSATEENSLHAGSLTYQIPLDRRMLLQFTLSASESETSSAQTIDQNGEFFSARIHLQSPLPDIGNLQHSVRTGFAWRDNTYRLNNSGNEESTHLQSFQWESYWEARIPHHRGETHVQVGMLLHPGEGIFSSNDETYQSLGAEDADSLIFNLQADRSISLHDWGQLDLRTEMQWSDQGLLASDQYYGTGYNRVRGFDESQWFADRALFFSAEWKGPRRDLGAQHSLQPVLFADCARLSDVNHNTKNLSSVGVGLRWNWQKHFYARTDLAFPLTEIDDKKREPMLHFSINTFW